MSKWQVVIGIGCGGRRRLCGEGGWLAKHAVGQRKEECIDCPESTQETSGAGIASLSNYHHSPATRRLIAKRCRKTASLRRPIDKHHGVGCLLYLSGIPQPRHAWHRIAAVTAQLRNKYDPDVKLPGQVLERTRTLSHNLLSAHLRVLDMKQLQIVYDDALDAMTHLHPSYRSRNAVEIGV